MPQKRIALRVSSHRIVCKMGIAIDLDDEFFSMAGKVHDKPTDGNLFAKMKAAGSEWVNQSPQTNLRRGRRASQLSCEIP